MPVISDSVIKLSEQQVEIVEKGQETYSFLKQLADSSLDFKKERMTAVKLRVNEVKSKIVYCKDSNRSGEHEHISFKFLGFQFQPRTVRSKFGKLFQSFSPAISNDNQSKSGKPSERPYIGTVQANRWNSSHRR